MITFEEVENQENHVNRLFDLASETEQDDDWMEYNSQFNRLGQMISDYGRNYKRQKKIKIILKENDDRE